MAHLVKHGDFCVQRHPPLIISLVNSFGIMGPETAFITSSNLCEILKDFATEQTSNGFMLDHMPIYVTDLQAICNCLLIISHSKHT